MFRSNACPSSEELARYVAGAAPPGRHERLERHLRECAHCRREVATLRRLEGLLAESRPTEPPADLVRRALQAAQTQLAPTTHRRPLVPQIALGAVAVAAALVLVLHATVFTTTTPRGNAPVTVAVAPPSTPTPVARPVPAAAAVVAASVAAAVVPAPRSAARAARMADAGRRLAARRRLAASGRVAAQPMPVARAVAADHALRAANQFARVGDVDLQAAVLENVALAYPQTAQAAQALLAAADLHRAQGDLGGADAAYREVTTMAQGPALSRALAYKALGDMRRQAAGNDETARRHYRQAAEVLEQEARRTSQNSRVRALLALGDVEETLGHGEKAAAAYAEAAAFGSTPALRDESSKRLAQVL